MAKGEGELSDLNNDRLLSVAEAAEYLGIKDSTVYAWVSQKRIPYVKVGRRTMFKRELLDKHFKEVPPKAA